MIASGWRISRVGRGTLRFTLALLPDSLGLRPGVVSRPLTTPALRRTVMLTQVAGRPHGATVTNFMKLCRARAFA